MFAHLIRNALHTASAASLVVAAVGALGASARADTAERIWSESLMEIGACGTSSETFSASTRCFVGSSVNRLIGAGTRWASDYGKSAFGQHFQIVGNLTYSPNPDQTGLVGDLDTIFPFAGGGSEPGLQGAGSALFLQQGVTRWWDSTSSVHNDLRHGLVYRFRTSDELDADILGVSVFHLTNMEQRHEVLVPSIDYMGRWGTASLRYFNPTTDWRATGSGQMERALEGMELATGLDITSTLRLNTTGYRWESEDGSGQWTKGMRLDIGWRPHPWLRLSAGYDRMTEGKDTASFLAGFRIPLGSQSKPPRWEGLGFAGGGSAPVGTDLWRPAEGIGQIRVATLTSPESLVSHAEVRFLQDTVSSGGSVLLEVILPAAAPQDIRVSVRLVPGSGSNPAVPGEDFVDESVETTIATGARKGRVSVQLLRNSDMREGRSLAATVSVVSS